MRLFCLFITFCTLSLSTFARIKQPATVCIHPDNAITAIDSENVDDLDTLVVVKPLSNMAFMPLIYTNYQSYNNYDPFAPEYKGDKAMRWIEEAEAVDKNVNMLRQRIMINNPAMVRYNLATLPEAPKQFYGVVNPKDHTIEIKPVEPTDVATIDINVKKRHWIRTFSSSLQFSQAYVSPNWYQGGNNNLNMLANIYYNVKLNTVYHPKLLFESTFQYKLGMNNAPDDSLRNYSISEDLLQINTTFGYKAAKRWYYSVTAQFKTQLLNSYVKNTKNLASAFLSPAELTAGLGMTYNYANQKKTFTFDASISPISFTTKICTQSDSRIAHSAYGIDADKHSVTNFGSSAECKINWQITNNINFKSRLYTFTDYKSLTADWENTLSMDINKYLSTQIYVHARYDTTTPPCADPSWHKLQLKEILSFGVAYKFSTL